MTDEPQHTYPSRYPKGEHWAVDVGWEVLDRIKPGLIPNEIRAYLAGAIAGVAMKYAAEGKPEEKERTTQ